MNKASFIRACWISLVLGALYPAAHFILFSAAIEFDPPINMSTLATLSPDEQASAMDKSARTVRGVRALLVIHGAHPYFWFDYAKLMAFGFVFSFVSSAAALRWAQSRRRDTRLEGNR